MANDRLERRARPWRHVASPCGLSVLSAVAPGPIAGRCPLYSATGLWCPGCGSTRAAAALIRLDVPAAISAQPLLPVVLVTAVAMFIRRRRTAAPIRQRHYGVAVVLFAAYGVARNLPFPIIHLLAPP